MDFKIFERIVSEEGKNHLRVDGEEVELKAYSRGQEAFRLSPVQILGQDRRPYLDRKGV